MNKWILLLIAMTALVLATPAMAYVSVKNVYDPAYVPGENVDVVITQNFLVGWEVNLQRLPSGPVTTWPDSGLPVVTDRQPGKTFALWTAYNGTSGPYIPESTTFATVPGYNTYITIVPVLDKFWVPDQ